MKLNITTRSRLHRLWIQMTAHYGGGCILDILASFHILAGTDNTSSNSLLESKTIAVQKNVI